MLLFLLFNELNIIQYCGGKGCQMLIERHVPNCESSINWKYAHHKPTTNCNDIVHNRRRTHLPRYDWGKHSLHHRNIIGTVKCVNKYIIHRNKYTCLIK